MTDQAKNGDRDAAIDRLEGSLFATRVVLQVVLDKGLPSVGLNQALVVHRRLARKRRSRGRQASSSTPILSSEL